MIRDLGRSIGDAILENVGRAAGRVQERRDLPADLLESEDAVLVVLDAPAASASDVQVRYVGDRVEVRIERFRNVREGFEMRYPGRGVSLQGSVRLPADAAVDPEGATATVHESGTLHVRLPKVDGERDDEARAGDGGTVNTEGA